MSTQTRATLKSYFETGDKPTQQQFADLIDSMALTTETSSSFETEHLKLFAQTIEENNENGEIIGITSKLNPNIEKLSIAVIKSTDNPNEMVVLGGFDNGFAISRNNIQTDGTADTAIYMAGTRDFSLENNSNISFLVHNIDTQEILKLSIDDFKYLVQVVTNYRNTLKYVSYSDINNASNISEIVIPLDNFTIPANNYVKSLFIDISAFDNVSAIQDAYITIPGHPDHINVLQHLSSTKSFVMPIALEQEIFSTPTQLSLVLNFDAGNDEVNPQNFTQGHISIQAIINGIYDN